MFVRVKGGAAKIDAWIDFNGDGSFSGPGEQIATSIVSPNVGNSINLMQIGFNVPSTAVVGNTYACFRISTAGGLSPTGLAANGEVEDYRLTVVAPPAVLSVLATGTEELGSHETAPPSHSVPPEGILSENAVRDEAILLQLNDNGWKPSLVVDKRRDAPNAVRPREDAALPDDPVALDALESAFSSVTHQWL